MYILGWWLRRWRMCLQCRRPEFDPWIGKIPWRREWQPTSVFWPGEFHRQRSLAGSRPWGQRLGHNWANFTFTVWVGMTPWRRARQPTPVFLPRESMDRGAWRATVHGVANSWTQLKWISMRALAFPQSAPLQVEVFIWWVNVAQVVSSFPSFSCLSLGSRHNSLILWDFYCPIRQPSPHEVISIWDVASPNGDVQLV